MKIKSLLMIGLLSISMLSVGCKSTETENIAYENEQFKIIIDEMTEDGYGVKISYTVENKTDKEILEFASAVAVAALSSADAISGLREEKEIQELCKGFKRKEIC